MLWGKKDEELPEKIRDKTPEQVAAALEEAEGLKSKVAELETSVRDSNARFESFGTQMGQLNETLTQLTTRLQPQQRQEQTHELADFISDPDRAFAERVAPLANLQLQTAAVIARNSAVNRAQMRQRNGKGNIDATLFEKFGAEIDQLATGVPAAQLANPDTWDHLFYNIKGRHADEIVSHNRERKGDFFVEPTTTSVPADGGDQEKLTPIEEKLAAKMGVAPEKYLAQKKKMVLGVPEEILR